MYKILSKVQQHGATTARPTLAVSPCLLHFCCYSQNRRHDRVRWFNYSSHVGNDNNQGSCYARLNG
jgi:hypothetical protein